MLNVVKICQSTGEITVLAKVYLGLYLKSGKP
jgi:hypothetical protein